MSRVIVWRAFEDKSYRDGPPHAFLSQEQSYSDAIRRSAAYMKNIKEWDISLEDEKATIRQLVFNLQMSNKSIRAFFLS